MLLEYFCSIFCFDFTEMTLHACGASVCHLFWNITFMFFTHLQILCNFDRALTSMFHQPLVMSENMLRFAKFSIDSMRYDT